MYSMLSERVSQLSHTVTFYLQSAGKLLAATHSREMYSNRHMDRQ